MNPKELTEVRVILNNFVSTNLTGIFCLCSDENNGDFFILIEKNIHYKIAWSSVLYMQYYEVPIK
jgi:hypothetical protein